MQAFLNNTGVGSLHLVLVGYLFIFLESFGGLINGRKHYEKQELKLSIQNTVFTNLSVNKKNMQPTKRFKYMAANF